MVHKDQFHAATPEAERLSLPSTQKNLGEQVEQGEQPVTTGATAVPPTVLPEGTGGTRTAVPLKMITPQDETPETQDIAVMDIERPGYGVYDDYVRFADSLGVAPHPPGLYWHGVNKTGDSVDTRVGAPLRIKALSHDEHKGNFGRLLYFLDTTNQWKEWLVPMALLAGNGEALRAELLNRGYTYNDRKKHHILSYIMQSRPYTQLVAATRTGWHGEQTAFVLPHITLGDDSYRFQAERTFVCNLSTQGTLEGWRTTIAQRCTGNPILALAVCTAFAGPLLKPAKLQATGGAGINLLGKSSQGKTTALQVAASVWGSPETVRNWSSTGNGLEALAASLNDTLLTLDELSQSSPFEAGNMVYLLANGNGKQRASRSGGIRQAAQWRIMVLSSGERTLSAHMEEGGKKSKAGQEARLLDLPATDRQFGVFDNLHEEADGRAFSDTLKQAAGQHYGTPGQAFVQHLMEYKGDLPKYYSEFNHLPRLQANDGVEARAAGTFALLALAGELATEFGLTGWQEGEAVEASAVGFQLWRDHRGHGNTEDRQILQSITDFIEAHGDSRFSDMDTPENPSMPIRNRAGYWKQDCQGRIYYFTSGALKEAGAGYDLKVISKALDDAGWIMEKNNGKNSIRKRINGSNIRLYAIQRQEGAL